MLFLYEWKSNQNVTAATRNINAAFGNGSVNERTVPSWYAKFGIGDESLTNKDRGRSETVVGNKVYDQKLKKSWQCC